MELAQPYRRHMGERGHHYHTAGIEADEAESGEQVEVDRPGEGAAALTGSGEPE